MSTVFTRLTAPSPSTFFHRVSFEIPRNALTGITVVFCDFDFRLGLRLVAVTGLGLGLGVGVLYLCTVVGYLAD